MPNVFVYWVEGRTKEQKKKIVEGFSEVMEDAGIPKDTVSIGFIETSPENFAKGGVFWSEREKKK